MTLHAHRTKHGREPEFTLSVLLTGDRKSRHPFWTLKSARHYAKSICNNENVSRIVLTGPGTNIVMSDANALD